MSAMDTEISKRKEEVDKKMARVRAVIDRIDVLLSCKYAYVVTAWEINFLNSLKEQLETQISRRIPAGVSVKQGSVLCKIERGVL